MMTAPEPVFRVVRGDPDEAETAALTVVLLASLAPREAPDEVPARPGAWASRAAAMRALPPPGPGAWRRSALPG